MKTFVLALLAASYFNFSCPAYAQSVEEQLITCIEDSQDILRYANAWRKSVEEIGGNPRPSDFADLTTSSLEMDTMASILRRTIEGGIDGSAIAATYEAEAAPVILKNELIRNMVEEGFNSPNEFTEMARYVSICSNNFGGNVVKLAEVNEQLEQRLKVLENAYSRLRKENQEQDTLYENLVSNTATMINNRLEQANIAHEREMKKYEKINDRLCEWVKNNGGKFFLNNANVKIDSLKVSLCKK